MKRGFSEQMPRGLWQGQRGGSSLQLPGPPLLAAQTPRPGRLLSLTCKVFTLCCSSALLPSGDQRRPCWPGLKRRGDSLECLLCLCPLCRARHRAGHTKGHQEGAGLHAHPWRPGSAWRAGLSLSLPCWWTPRRRVSLCGGGGVRARWTAGGCGLDSSHTGRDPGCDGLLHTGRRPLCHLQLPRSTSAVPRVFQFK